MEYTEKGKLIRTERVRKRDPITVIFGQTESGTRTKHLSVLPLSAAWLIVLALFTREALVLINVGLLPISAGLVSVIFMLSPAFSLVTNE